MDKMYYNGTEYELAPKTMKIARQIEKTEKSETITEAYRNEFDLVKMALGAEVTHELLGTSNLEEIDLNEMVIIYNAVIDGYDAAILDMRQSKENEIFNSPTFKAIKDLARDVRTITDVENTKAFVGKK